MIVSEIDFIIDDIKLVFLMASVESMQISGIGKEDMPFL